MAVGISIGRVGKLIEDIIENYEELKLALSGTKMEQILGCGMAARFDDLMPENRKISDYV